MIVTENKALNGIEVVFDMKPSKATLDTLKQNGFHWHREKKLWYAKDNAKRRAILESIQNGKSPVKPKDLKSVENVHGVKVGDIFILSFGYSMILYDFFQVVSVTENSCRIVEVELPYTGGDCFHPRFKGDLGVIYPKRDGSQWIKDQNKGDIKRTAKDQYGLHITIGNRWAKLYDGREVEEDHLD